LNTGVYLQGGSGGYAKAWLAREDAKAEDEVLLLARRADRRSLTSNWLSGFAILIAVASLLVALFHW
jgi:hypothetical protein